MDCQTLKVAQLIDKPAFRWKLDPIRAFISQEEAKSILSIPLSSFLTTDEVVWKKDGKGTFPVKSGYVTIVAPHI